MMHKQKIKDEDDTAPSRRVFSGLCRLLSRDVFCSYPAGTCACWLPPFLIDVSLFCYYIAHIRKFTIVMTTACFLRTLLIIPSFFLLNNKSSYKVTLRVLLLLVWLPSNAAIVIYYIAALIRGHDPWWRVALTSLSLVSILLQAIAVAFATAPPTVQEREEAAAIFSGYFVTSAMFSRHEYWSVPTSLDSDDEARVASSQNSAECSDIDGSNGDLEDGLNSISYIVLTTPRPGDEREQQSTEAYLDSLKVQLAKGRQLWNEKIRNVHDFVESLKLTSRRWSRRRPTTAETIRPSQEVFICVLKLFTTVSTASIGKMLRECHGKYPRDFEDQIPQLVIFLLCGSFEKAPALQTTLLGLCKKSLPFAYKMYYFIESFCRHRSELMPEEEEALDFLLGDIAASGAMPCGLLSLHVSRQQQSPAPSSSSTRKSNRPSHEKDVGLEISLKKCISDSISVTDLRNLVLEEYELQMNKDALREGSTSSKFSDQHENQNEKPMDTPESEDYRSCLSGEEDYEECVVSYEERDDRATLSPTRRVNSSSAVDHSMTPKETVIKRAMSAKTIAGSVISQRKKIKSDLFYKNIDFWEKVVDVSRFLCTVGKSDRNSALRDTLEQISKRFLPSSTICALVGDVCHRVWTIHIAECFVFNTKERVPFMLCLEVLEYSSNHLELCRTALVHLEGHQSSVDPEDCSTVVSANARVVKYAKDCLSSSDKSQKLETKFEEGINEHLDYFPGIYDDFSPPPASFSHAIDIDPYFGERWQDKESRIRQSSRIGHLHGWKLLPCMVKSGDDLRQEQFASYIIKQMHEIYQQCGVDCWTRPYDVVALSPDSGLIEMIPDSISLDSLYSRMSKTTCHPTPIDSIRSSSSDNNRDVEKAQTSINGIKSFFEMKFGPQSSKEFKIARDNFMKSLAGYSMICYILQLKDRHNGNLLIDRDGHCVHIDFGFILGKTPGQNMGFESAPFKLTSDFVDLLGGMNSATFQEYRDLCSACYLALRKEKHRITLGVEMLVQGADHLPLFFGDPKKTLVDLNARFMTEMSDRAAMQHVDRLINEAADNWTTTCYDRYQRCCSGIF